MRFCPLTGGYSRVRVAVMPLGFRDEGTPDMTQPYDGASSYEPGGFGQDDPSTAEQAQQQAAGVAGEAKAQAAGTVQDATAQAGRVAEQAKGQARDVAQHAKHEARGLLNQAQGELSSQAGTQQQRLAGLLRELSEELRGILDPHNTDYRQGMVTDVAHQASSRLATATSWLENREPADVLHEVSRFGRRRPGTFLALAAVAGLVVGRLSRGMADDARDDSGRRDRAYGGTGGNYGTVYSSGVGTGAAYGAVDSAGVGTTTDYPPPAAPATYEPQGYSDPDAADTYGVGDPLGTEDTSAGQGHADDIASAYARESSTPTPTYDEVTGTPLSTGEGRDAQAQRMPTIAEPDQTYTPQAGTTLGEEGR